VADALGLHLDQFQRIQAAPASLSVIRYTGLRPFVVRTNDVGGGIDGLLPPPDAESEKRVENGAEKSAGKAAETGSRHTGGDGDAPVGGGA
jgi:hypothetical protein